jgi:hypothetical protein
MTENSVGYISRIGVSLVFPFWCIARDDILIFSLSLSLSLSLFLSLISLSAVRYKRQNFAVTTK